MGPRGPGQQGEGFGRRRGLWFALLPSSLPRSLLSFSPSCFPSCLSCSLPSSFPSSLLPSSFLLSSFLPLSRAELFSEAAGPINEKLENSGREDRMIPANCLLPASKALSCWFQADIVAGTVPENSSDAAIQDASTLVKNPRHPLKSVLGKLILSFSA